MGWMDAKSKWTGCARTSLKLSFIALVPLVAFGVRPHVSCVADFDKKRRHSQSALAHESKSRTGVIYSDSREEADVPILDALEDVLRFPSGAILSIRKGSTSRAAFKSALDDFFNSIPTLEKAHRIKGGRYTDSVAEEYSYLANMSFMEGKKKMSSRSDENFERDMDSWLLLSIMQSDMLKVLRLREASLKLFHEGRSSRHLAGVQGFTPEYKKNQAWRERVQGKVWIGLSMISFFNLLGTLGYATQNVAAILTQQGNVVHGINSGLSTAQLADSMKQLALHGAQYGNYIVQAATYSGLAMAIADKMADEEAKALVRAGPANVLTYWPDTEMGHMYVGYTAVNNIIHSILGEFNRRPVVLSKIEVNTASSSEPLVLRKGALLGATNKFGPMPRTDGEIEGEEVELTKIVWRKKESNDYMNAWVDVENVASAARYTATEPLQIYESQEGMPNCLPKNEYIYPGEVFYIAAKDCTRCGLAEVHKQCLWKLGDGRGWIHQTGCGVISDPLGSEDQLEDELESIGATNLLGNRTWGKARNINLSKGASVARALIYVVLGIGTAAFAIASAPAAAVAFLGGAVLGFLAGIAGVLKVLAISSAVFTALDSAAYATANVKGLDTIESRSFLAQAALAHWERHLWDVEDCDITDERFCKPGELCLRGGVFFRRKQYSPLGRCMPGQGNQLGGKCIIHKDCSSGYCHTSTRVMQKSNSANATEEDIVQALLGTCVKACKLGTAYNGAICSPVSPKYMFGILRTSQVQAPIVAQDAQPQATIYPLGLAVEVLRTKTQMWEPATVTGHLATDIPAKPKDYLEITYSNGDKKTIHHSQLAEFVRLAKATAGGPSAVNYIHPRMAQSAAPNKSAQRFVGEVPAPRRPAAGFKYVRHDGGYISAGGELLEAKMTPLQAMIKCKELRGCLGFMFQSTDLDSPVHVYFKNKFDIQKIAGWTSYQTIEALAVPVFAPKSAPLGEGTGVSTAIGHTNLIAAFPVANDCSNSSQLAVASI